MESMRILKRNLVYVSELPPKLMNKKLLISK